MMPSLIAVALSVGVFFGMVACFELGFRVGRSRAPIEPTAHEGIGMIGAAILALLGLLLAFAFAGGMSRLDVRRELAVREANVISNAYDLLDVLPPADKAELRHLFRKYIGARLRVYDVLPDIEAATAQNVIAAQLRGEIWKRAVAAGKLEPTGNATRLLLPALTELGDMANARTVALKTHLPPLIFVLLIAVALLSGVVAGYAMGERKDRSVLHMLIYAATVSITIYAVVDLDFPGFGLIQLETAEKILIDLHDSTR
ncbi:MAG: hypothetical protein ACREMQ_12010 [Longimicrobiales bacterium]